MHSCALQSKLTQQGGMWGCGDVEGGGDRAWHTSLECSSETTIVHPAKASFGIPMVTLKEKGSILLISAFGGSLFKRRQNLSQNIWRGCVWPTAEHSIVKFSLFCLCYDSASFHIKLLCLASGGAFESVKFRLFRVFVHVLKVWEHSAFRSRHNLILNKRMKYKKSNNSKASNWKTKQCKFLSPPPLIKSVEYPKSSFCNHLALAHSKIELQGVILTVIISTKYICAIIYQNDIYKTFEKKSQKRILKGEQ